MNGRIAASDRELARALDALPDPAFLLRPVRSADGELEDLQFRYANAAACVLFRRPARDIVGLSQSELFLSAEHRGVVERYASILAAGSPGLVEVTNVDEHGVATSLLLHAAPVDGDLMVIARDVTAMRGLEAARDVTAEQLRAIVDNSVDGIARYGPDLRVEFVNRRAVELSGIPVEAWVGSTHADLGYPPELADLWDRHLATVFATGQATFYTYDLVTTEGQTWWEASLAPEFGPDGTVTHVVSVNRDVTARVLVEELLTQRANQDSLTGLANRAGLTAELARAQKSAQRSGHRLAVLMLDVDRFKSVNDTHGHAAGDRLLAGVADRLRSVARGTDLVARLGGDEFVIVMRDLAGPQEAVTAAWRLVEALREPMVTPDGELLATASVGVAVGQGSDDPTDLLREADVALYQAKSEGRDRVAVFNG